MKYNFSKTQVEKVKEEVLQKNGLKILYNMSTSGDFSVKQCVDDKGENFILKIRKKNTELLKRKFINEILINKFLSKVSKDKFPYEIISYSIKSEPEYLLYKMVRDVALHGYYFLIGKRNAKYYSPGEVVGLLKLIQAEGINFQKENSEANLVCNDYRGMKAYFLRHEEIYNKYFGKEPFSKVKKIIEVNKNLLNTDLVLSHGDLNPKNILVGTDGKTTFIDWTDLNLSNPLSDVARLYLASWNVKGKQRELKKEAIKKIKNNEKLFNLNILIITGNFIKILDDSRIGLEEDFKSGFIKKETRDKLLNEILKAKEETIYRFKKSLDYLSGSLIENKNFDKIINDFSSEKFVRFFLNKNKNKLGVSGEVATLKLNIHHKRCGENSKRLIVTYIFQDAEGEKKYTAKIRIYKGNNLAGKSWFMSRLLWDSVTGKDEYIAKPIYYFEDYGVFIYKTALGRSFGEILKREILSEDDKIGKIKKATKYLAELHKIDIAEISKSKFLAGHNIFTHVNFLEEYLKNRKEDHEIRIRDAIRRVKKLAKKFSNIKKSLIHGDFQVENFIFDGNNLKLIDFDDSEINDPLADVGNFLVQMYYGGIMGENVDYYRKIFLKEYLKYNDQLDRRFLNERLNLYIVTAKLKNISQKVIRGQNISDDDFAGVMWDIIRIEKRLDDLAGDPIKFFKV